MLHFQNKPNKELVDCLVNGIKASRKYPPVVRKFAVSLHFLSPRAYNFVRDTFEKNLPDPATMRRWYQYSDMNCMPGVHDSVLKFLEQISTAMKAKDSKLVATLSFDEMHIRQQICWSNSDKKILGYVTFGWDKENAVSEEMPPVASQAIVFMVSSLNGPIFHLPVAYHFVHKLNGKKKRDLLFEVLNKLETTGITISNITFDGAKENGYMCKLLGANLNVNSANFKPYFNFHEQRIYIIYDACHMDKLVRNAIGDRKVMYHEGKKIEWKYFELLVEFRKKGFAMVHKMNQKHLLFYNRRMKVNLAVQTLSGSSANSMLHLKEEGWKEFENVDGTAEFAQTFNNLFDVFNTMKEENSNLFKQNLSAENKDVVFQFLERAEQYIRGLQIQEKDGSVKNVLDSLRSTAFVGFIVNIKSLMLMYKDYVEDSAILRSISTYLLSQDFLEMFFGKNRGCYGYNDNPTVQDFCASYRKLMVSNTINISKDANCAPQLTVISEPISNIFSVSSVRKVVGESNLESGIIVPLSEEMEELYAKLSDVEAIERNSLHQGLSDLTIAYIAGVIEKRMRNAKAYCSGCANIFNENIKLNRSFMSSNLVEKPCRDTFTICKQANQFLKLQLINGTVNFNTLYYAIFADININSIFNATDFTGHEEHKLYFIRKIADVYIQIKGTYIARSTTFDSKEFKRSFLRKLVHIRGE